MVEPGRYAYDGLARVIHEKARLSILTALAAHPDGVRFPELRELCALTDGNLARHLQALKEADLVDVEKRSRVTLCRLTGEGRAQFEAYLEELERVVRDAAPRRARRPGLEGAG